MPPSANSITSWIRERVAALLDLDPFVIRDDEALTRYGLDSPRATRLVADLGTWLDRTISPVVAFEYPTIGALANHLAEPPGAPERRPSAWSPPTLGDEPIAVVGLACRFPGAADPHALWEALCAGRHTARKVDDSRWSISRYHSDAADVPGHAHTRWAGLLDETQIRGFDPLFFNISPREAEEIDPQQRMFLELCWEALQDAGMRPFGLAGSRTGVFAGVIWEDYGQLAQRDATAISMHTATGKSRGMVANRVSYTFGLQGPSVAVDTACSSSLVAVHLGCQSLLCGDSDLVIAGGINLLLDPATMVGLSKFGGLSAGAMCRAFDADADGFVRGEGGGAVVLKRLSRAVADGDRVYAVIRGSAVNNDGASNGLTAPNPAAQQDVIERAWMRASVEPSEVDYVEAHGTGTVLGDPIEAKALGTVLGGELRPPDRPLRVGSIKTNIGHLEAAAGIAGFIKTVLSLQHGMLLPSLHAETLNPHIPFESLRLRVQTRLEPWPAHEDSAPRRAGVSAFGWGGTNCHVALESADDPAAVRQWRLAGSDADSLRAAIEAWESPQGVVSGGRQRLALTTDDPMALPELLEAAIAGRARPEVAWGELEPRPQLAFVCSPQGGQWRGMARSMLAQQPAFREAVHELDEAYRAHASWSLLDALTRDQASWAWERVHTLQPMIVAVQIGIAAVWRAWGIVPDVYVGHSLGEITAAYLAGSLELDELARLVIHYSRLQATTDPQGAMAITGLSPAGAMERVASSRDLVVAGHNGPQSVVLSGPRSELGSLIDALRADGVFARFVDVNVAAHSPRIDPIVDELRRELEPLRPQVAHTPIISTLLSRELTGHELGADYWPRNLREPVKFAEAVEILIGRNVTAFVELNPHPILVPSIRQTLAARGHRALVMESTRRGEDETRALLEGLGRLFVTGHDASCRRRYLAAPRRDRAVVDDPAALLATASVAVPLSGRSTGGLRALAEDLRERCTRAPQPGLLEVSRGLARSDGGLSHRRVAVLDTAESATTAFAPDAQGTVLGNVDPKRRRKVVFVCPGQGSQWRGMARDLLASEPTFYEEIARIDRAARPYMQVSLLDELLEPEPGTWTTDVVQPLLFALEVALGKLWSSWGVEPDAIVGHSMGEVAAYHLAGAVSLDDAVRVICLRSRLLLRASGRGAMLAAELSVGQARELLIRREQHVAIAVDNSPTSTVLAGDAEILEDIRRELDARGVFCRFVNVDVASHSPQMDPLLDELRMVLDGVGSRHGKIPVYSTVRGARIEGESVDASYWIDNLRQTVRFGESIQQLVADGHDLFIELSPHPILLTAVEQGIDASGDSAAQAMGSMRRNEPGRRVMLEGAARAFVLGHKLRWPKIVPAGPATTLVGRPWERDPYWLPSEASAMTSTGWSQGQHVLLGQHVDNALDLDAHLWHLDLAVASVPWLADHRVWGSTITSVAVAIEMVLAALSERDAESVALKQLRLEHPLVLPERGARTVQVALRDPPSDSNPRCGSFGVYGRGPEDGSWTAHVTGSFVCGVDPGRELARLDCVREALGEAEQDPASFYRAQGRRGIVFGPCFRAARRLWTGPDEALAQVKLPEAAGVCRDGFRIHPIVLDGALQAVLAALDDGDETFLSVGIERVVVRSGVLPTSLWSHARIDAATASGIEAHVVVYGEDGSVVARVEGLQLARVAHEELPASTPTIEASLPLADRLRAEAPGIARRARFEALVREQLGLVLKIPGDRIDASRPLQAMGLTSLMTLELRNRLGALLGTRLPSTLAWNYPTLTALVGYLGSRLPLSLDCDQLEAEPTDVAPIAVAPANPVAAALADGVDGELLEELSRVDALLANL